MSHTDALTAAAAHTTRGRVIPMFVCAGCRPEPLGYTSLEYGDNLDEMLVCPMREVCTWHAAHDLGGSGNFSEQPADAQLAPLFTMKPYFACRNFHDYSIFLAGRKPAPTPVRIEPAGGRCHALISGE